MTERRSTRDAAEGGGRGGSSPVLPNLDALDWDALDTVIPLPRADAAFTSPVRHEAAAPTGVVVPAARLKPEDAPGALDSLLDWDAMDSAVPLPSLSPR